MLTCKNCKKITDSECSVYKREPPDSFASKCRHYEKDENYTPPKKRSCDGCKNNDEGWCLRLDHPEWKYNFVKIKPGIKCPKAEGKCE